MKIGFVLDDSLDKADGVQQYILTLGRWLHEHGHNVHYLVGETHRKDIANVHSLARNARVRFNGNRMSTPLPASKDKLKSLLQKQNFDILHVQMPYSPWLAGRLVRLASSSTAIVGTFHILPFARRERVATHALRPLIRGSLKRFDHVFAVSKPAAIFARKSLKLHATVLPNVVDLARFQDSKPFPKYKDGKITIVFLGRLVPRKGCLHLLEALAALHAKHQLQQVRVLVCGSGPEQAALERYSHDKHLGHAVHFTGFVSELDKPRYLASADIAVFPSLAGESFGIVLIEAMAAGSGVVMGGDNVGYHSVLGARPDQLVTPGDTKAFTKSLLHFIRNARARQQANRWQAQAITQYDVAIVGPQMIARYQEVLQRRQGVQ